MLLGVVALAIPLLGLVLLLAVPEVDGTWEHHPSHFWLVLGTAAIAATVGWMIGATARRRADARLFLVSLAFLCAASFLGLHALATPEVLLETSTAGFVLATPVGLFLAAVFAAWSAVDLDGDRARWVLARAHALRLAVVVVIVLWAVWSLASLPPIDDPSPPESGSAALVGVAIPTLVLFTFAAWRYLQLGRHRRATLALAVGAAWILLGEAMVAVAFARNWRASWWEWHLLMLAAFATVAEVARQLPEPERFEDLYLDEVAGATRPVSVLFADLVGYTTFSEAHASDEVHAMLNTYFDAIEPAIGAAGGRVDRYIGDAVMVTFNVTTHQPDHATRAARAALALQDAAATVGRAHPDWPSFRVGINSGEATVGVIGGGRTRGYTVIGDTVNLAARLEGLAPAGGAVISAATLQAIDGARVSPMGTVTVKGRAAPVEIWRLDGLDTVRS
jgi:adenylate cyclase